MDEEGFVQTDLYRKPNTKNNYLLPSSAHPNHIFKNIPYSLAHRVVRACSRLEDRSERLEELAQLLLDRGYRRGVVRSAISRAERLDRDEALEKVVREEEQTNRRVRFVVEYDPRLPQISRILKRNWEVMVDLDTRLRKSFPGPPMVCYRRPPNLRDILCRARLPPLRHGFDRSRPGFRRCNKNGCSLCPFTGLEPAQVESSVMVEHSGLVHEIKQQLYCNSKNVIYLLSCKRKDRGQYVGETGKTGEQRFRGHLNSVRNNTVKTTTVGEHYRGISHSVSDMVFVPFEQVRSRDPWVRKAREEMYINNWQLITHGLNRKL